MLAQPATGCRFTNSQKWPGWNSSFSRFSLTATASISKLAIWCHLQVTYSPALISEFDKSQNAKSLHHPWVVQKQNSSHMRNIKTYVCTYFSGVVPRDSQKYVALSLHRLLCSQTFDEDLQNLDTNSMYGRGCWGLIKLRSKSRICSSWVLHCHWIKPQMTQGL